MNKALADYLAELQSRRYSGSRLTHVRRTIEMLMLYLKEAHQLADWRAVNESHLRGFAVFVATRHRTAQGNLVSPDTLRQWLSCIRGFFGWMNESGRLVHDPSERLKLPRKSRTFPHVLSESDIAQLIETPDTNTKLGLRDRALMEVLYATGIRLAEAHKLDLYDVDTSTGLLFRPPGQRRPRSHRSSDRNCLRLALTLHHWSPPGARRRAQDETQNQPRNPHQSSAPNPAIESTHSGALADHQRSTTVQADDRSANHRVRRTNRHQSNPSHVPPFLRHSPPQRRRKHPSCAAAFRTSRPRNHRDLHPR